MMDGLDVVAVGIEQEGRVIAGVIIGPFAWRAIIPAARFKAGGMERVDHRAVFSLEGDMVAASEDARRFRPVGLRYKQLVTPEMAGRVAFDGNVQNAKHGLVEAPAGVEVGDDQLNMIDQSAAMQFHFSLLPG